MIWLQHNRKKGKLDLPKDDIYDLGFWMMAGVLIGSRLFEILIWEPSYYLNNPIEIIKFWNGGMAFHGGMIGIVIATLLLAKKKKWNWQKFAKIADMVATPVMLGVALGRIGNFINGELWGRVTDVKWCFKFSGADGCRHPVQLYAAGKRLIVFGWLLFLHYRKEFKPGFIFWNFILWENVGRLIVDFWREDTLHWGLSTGQWTSIIIILPTLYIFWKYYKEDVKKII